MTYQEDNTDGWEDLWVEFPDMPGIIEALLEVEKEKIGYEYE